MNENARNRETTMQKTEDFSSVQSFWAKETGIKEWIIFDIYEALKQRFVGNVYVMEPQCFKQYEKTSLLFLANHQTTIESPVFDYIVGGLQKLPVIGLAKKEHRFSWLGKLMTLADQYSGARLMYPMKFIDRDNPIAALKLLNGLGRFMRTEGHSTLIHVEGTRATHVGKPVRKMSSKVIDIAVEGNIPIIPVRFTGGVPIANEGKQYVFPYRFGKQDYWIGAPIRPEDLAILPKAERKKAVLDAINRLGVRAENEKPSPPCEPIFLEEVNRWHVEHGVTMKWAVILQCLAELRNKSNQTERFLHFVRTGSSTFSSSHQDWFRQLFNLMKLPDESA